MSTETNDQWAAALHEAGHVVVACVLGYPPSLAYINRKQDGQWEGLTSELDMGDDALSVAATGAAGPLAEVQLRGALPDECHSDVNRVWDGSAQRARDRHPDGEDHNDKVAAGVEAVALATRVLLEAWQLVEQLAQELTSSGQVEDPCASLSQSEIEKAHRVLSQRWCGPCRVGERWVLPRTSTDPTLGDMSVSIRLANPR